MDTRLSCQLQHVGAGLHWGASRHFQRGWQCVALLDGVAGRAAPHSTPVTVGASLLIGATRHSCRPLGHSVALQGQCLGRQALMASTTAGCGIPGGPHGHNAAAAGSSTPKWQHRHHVAAAADSGIPGCLYNRSVVAGLGEILLQMSIAQSILCSHLAPLPGAISSCPEGLCAPQCCWMGARAAAGSRDAIPACSCLAWTLCLCTTVLRLPFPYQLPTRFTRFKLSEGFMCECSSWCKPCELLASESAQ